MYELPSSKRLSNSYTEYRTYFVEFYNTVLYMWDCISNRWVNNFSYLYDYIISYQLYKLSCSWPLGSIPCQSAHSEIFLLLLLGTIKLLNYGHGMWVPGISTYSRATRN